MTRLANIFGQSIIESLLSPFAPQIIKNTTTSLKKLTETRIADMWFLRKKHIHQN